MKKSILLGTGILATVLLTGCGGSGAGVSSAGLSVKNLTPVAGSDTIIGTWVGATDFVETSTGATYTGTRVVTVQITDDGAGGYELISCKSTHEKDVELDVNTGEVTALGRDFVMTNFNEMTGTSTKAEWGSSGQEDWSWVKVSNSTDGMGSITSNYTISNGQVSTTSELSALCRESYTYKDAVSSWTTLADRAAYDNNGTQYFYAGKDSDGWRNAEVPELGISVDSDEVNADLTVGSDSVTAYKASYSVTESTYTFTASLSQVISE